MRYLAIAVALLAFLTACATSPVDNAADVRGKVLLNEGITVPASLKVAYHTSLKERNKVITTGDGYGRWNQLVGKSLHSATELMVPSVFDDAESLVADAPFHYLLSFKGQPSFSSFMGHFTVELTVTVFTPDGMQIYQATTKTGRSGGGAGDGHAFEAAYASAIKDALHTFLNQEGNAKLQQLAKQPPGELTAALEDKLDIDTASTGTGFYINRQGELLTAYHVVKSCLKTEVQQRGEKYPAVLKGHSQVLDLALLSASHQPEAVAPMPQFSESDGLLGKQVFVTGFPLSDILSPYPSLTVGNISSVGGLRGGQGNFQFSAPIQPGNSGGPVLDYKGNVLGAVTSTLNQKMMLTKTGTTSQNLNFALNGRLIGAFLEKHGTAYSRAPSSLNFEQASAEAVKFTTQIICYQ
ncbi:serine protease [Spongiibacter taiwanensis]|uniref:S1 family peptidase n=1 Tax=Spongiibacter taiwanensis TaxID=1748242 RepID=UPI0020355BD3|nr:serine protease [Spongiibacter taiwanensis]USA42791.1 serine protease [Spongiibacter taiwanensis]